MVNKSFWQNFGDAVKYARSTSTLDGGGAYFITSQAKKDLREQGKKEEAKQLEKAEAIGTVGGAIAGLTLGKGVPIITRGISAFRTAFPKIATGIDLVLTADGIRNLATENGIQKTINYAKDGNWGRAAASGTMDALDLLGGVGLIGDVIKGYNHIKPSLSYLPKIKIKGIFDRGIETILRTGVQFGNEPRILKKQLLGNNYAGIKYIMGIDNSLAYNMPFKYSGNGPAQRVKAHPGDMIDVLMGKSDKLLDESGNVIGSVTNDASSVPSKYLEWLKSIQNTKEPRILDIPYYQHQAPLYIDGQRVFDIFDKGIPIELGRARSSDIRVQLPGPYKDGYKLVHAIDPWKHGVGVAKINNQLQGFGWDVYHYTPKQYLRTNSELARGFKIGKLLPITAGKPMIVQWKKRLHVGGEKSLQNTLSSNLTEFPFKADDTFIIQEHVIPFRKSGGSIHIKKKNKGKFSKIRDYVDYKNNK